MRERVMVPYREMLIRRRERGAWVSGFLWGCWLWFPLGGLVILLVVKP